MIPPPSERDGNDVHERYRVIAAGQATGIDGQPYYGYEDDLSDQVTATFSSMGCDVERHNVRMVQGSYAETLAPAGLDTSVALAHIDCDWYESVLTCLNAVAPRLSVGGIIVIDDYDSWSGCRSAVDEYFSTPRGNGFEFVRRERLHIIRRW
jgi:asparagine synthase (glutamine-hydrolysing)